MKEENELKFVGFWTPVERCTLVRKKIINATECYLLGILDSLAGESAECRASNSRIAKLCGLSMRSVVYIVAKLKALDLIKVLDKKQNRVIIPPKIVTQRLAYPYAIPCALPSSSSRNSNLLLKEDSFIRGVPVPVTRQSSLEEDEMPFRPEQVKPKTDASPFDFSQADALHLIVVEKNRIRGKWSRSAWANEFKRLRLSLEDGEKRIATVVEWYSAHALDKSKKAPRISSVRMLRRHFQWLEDLAAKDARQCVEISDDAKRVAARVTMQRWPKESKETVAATVQLSLNAHRALRKRQTQLRSLLMSSKKTNNTPLSRFVNLVQTKLGQSEHFVEQWMKSVRDSIKHWDEWNGDLISLAFDPDSKRFQNMGRQWATSYSHAKLWDEYMEALNGLDS